MKKKKCKAKKITIAIIIIVIALISIKLLYTLVENYNQTDCVKYKITIYISRELQSNRLCKNN